MPERDHESRPPPQALSVGCKAMNEFVPEVVVVSSLPGQVIWLQDLTDDLLFVLWLRHGG